MAEEKKVRLLSAATAVNADIIAEVVEAELVKAAESALEESRQQDQAREMYGTNFQVARLGALYKDVNEEGLVQVRVLHDGTHDLVVNTHQGPRLQPDGGGREASLPTQGRPQARPSRSGDRREVRPQAHPCSA